MERGVRPAFVTESGSLRDGCAIILSEDHVEPGMPQGAHYGEGLWIIADDEN